MKIQANIYELFRLSCFTYLIHQAYVKYSAWLPAKYLHIYFFDCTVVLDILCTMQQDTKWLSTVMYCRPTCQQDVVLFAAMQTVKMGTTGYMMQTLQQIVNCA